MNEMQIQVSDSVQGARIFSSDLEILIFSIAPAIACAPAKEDNSEMWGVVDAMKNGVASIEHFSFAPMTFLSTIDKFSHICLITRFIASIYAKGEKLNFEFCA